MFGWSGTRKIVYFLKKYLEKLPTSNAQKLPTSNPTNWSRDYWLAWLLVVKGSPKLCPFESRGSNSPWKLLPRNQFSPSEITIGNMRQLWFRLSLIFKISCFYLCFLSSGKEGSRARILDIILASFEGVYSLDFSRHFSCVFKALLKRLIYAAFWARWNDGLPAVH